MKKSKIYMVSPWMILLMVALILGTMVLDVLCIKMILDKEKMNLFIWFCAGQMILFFPFNFCVIQLKKCILCDDKYLRIFLTERNQYLLLPKNVVKKVLIRVDDGEEVDPEDIEDLEEFGKVEITFFLHNGKRVDIKANYMNGKNMLKLFEEVAGTETDI